MTGKQQANTRVVRDGTGHIHLYMDGLNLLQMYPGYPPKV